MSPLQTAARTSTIGRRPGAHCVFGSGFVLFWLYLAVEDTLWMLALRCAVKRHASMCRQSVKSRRQPETEGLPKY